MSDIAKDKEDLIKQRDALRELADLIDEFIALEERGDATAAEVEALLGKFVWKATEVRILGG